MTLNEHIGMIVKAITKVYYHDKFMVNNHMQQL